MYETGVNKEERRQEKHRDSEWESKRKGENGR